MYMYFKLNTLKGIWVSASANGEELLISETSHTFSSREKDKCYGNAVPLNELKKAKS